MPLTTTIVESRLLDKIAPGNTEAFYDLLTEADERLLNSGKWAWTRGVLELVPVEYDNDGEYRVTLPDGYESIVGCRMGAIARGVNWQEIEYLEDAPSVIPIEGCSGQLIDKGLLDISGDSDSSATDIRRVYKVLGGPPDVITALARYEMNDYSATAGTEVNTRCQSLTALKQAMLAIIYEEANDLERSSSYMMMARKTLDEQEAAYRGSAKKVFKPFLAIPLSRRSRTNFM